jgi:D-lactate dehydrogenase
MRTTAGNFSLEGLQGFDLKGKTIGVVGTGHIGLHVVRIAKGFGMKVLAYDLRPSSIAAEILDFTYTDLDTLLGSSKIVTLHTPLNPHTRHLIGDHNIRKFKRGAILINTARGELIDTEALLKGLDEGWLSGAGLDVLEGEDVFSEEKQLLSNPNVTAESLKTALRNLSLLRRPDMVITPHIGFDSVEAVERILDTTIENIIAYRNGKVQNVVNA